MKDEFMKKYSKELKALSNKFNVDKGVCMYMLVAWYRNLNKPNKQYDYDFKGSNKVDVAELGKDIKELENNRIIPRFENNVWKW